MTPLRTGVDLVAVDEVACAVRRFGARYLDRVYTVREQTDCAGADGIPDARRLAVRFAAKEAAVKVLGPGDVPLPWTGVEVLVDPRGGVEVRWAGAAADLAAAAGVDHVLVSVARERGTVAAVALARTPGRDRRL